MDENAVLKLKQTIIKDEINISPLITRDDNQMHAFIFFVENLKWLIPIPESKIELNPNAALVSDSDAVDE